MAALCLPCTAAVASSAASDSRRINTVYNTVYSIPSTGTYTVPYQFVVSSARAWLIRFHIHVPYRIRYTRRASNSCTKECYSKYIIVPHMDLPYTVAYRVSVRRYVYKTTYANSFSHFLSAHNEKNKIKQYHST